MFVELNVRGYYRGRYITTSAMIAIDDISRVLECNDDYTCTNVVTKDGKILTVNEKYCDVVKRIKDAMRK